MIQIPLQAIPNQNLKYQAEDELYDITIRTTKYATHISISRDDEAIISNQILIPNSLVMRYNYDVTNGNFIFESMQDNLPDYNKFGVTQFLYYVDNSELE